MSEPQKNPLPRIAAGVLCLLCAVGMAIHPHAGHPAGPIRYGLFCGVLLGLGVAWVAGWPEGKGR